MPKGSSIRLLFSFWTCFVWVKILQGMHRLSGRKKSAETIKSIAIFAAFFPGNAGYHYRVQLWAERLLEKGLDVHIFYVDEGLAYAPNADRGREKKLARAMWKRLRQVRKSKRFDTVIVRRELLLYNDYGNLFMDKYLLQLHPNAILDFDDNISASKKEPRTLSTFGKVMLEHPSKFIAMLQLYPRFLAGTQWLADFVTEHRTNAADIHILPTCVDYNGSEKKAYNNSTPIRIGWIGSNTNQFYLDRLVEPLNRLYAEHPIEMLVISGDLWKHPDAQFPITNLKWSLELQESQMRQIDIGVMPLDDTPRSRGKCAFKLIQYMGLGIVSAASNITVNGAIIHDGENGFLVDTDEDWYSVLKGILNAQDQWSTVGEHAAERISSHYSFDAHLEGLYAFLTKKPVRDSQ